MTSLARARRRRRAHACCALALALSACGGASNERQREVRAAQQESSAEALYQRGLAAASIGDLTRAEQYFVASLKAGGDEKKIIKRLLVVCVSDQRFPVALEYAEQYLYRHPDDVDVQFAAASIHAALGHHDRARALLESVVRSRPESPDVHYALATVLRQQGGSSLEADRHDLEYLRLAPEGTHAEQARARLTGGPR